MNLAKRLADAAREVDGAWSDRALPPRTPPPSRAVPRLAGLVAVAVAIAALVWAGTRPQGGDGEPVVSTPLELTTTAPLDTTTAPEGAGTTTLPRADPGPPEELPPGWVDLALLPQPRYFAVLADAGEELLIFGGGRDPFTAPDERGFEAMWDGFAVDHESGRLRDLAPSPMCESGHPAGVWTGNELIVWRVAGLVLEECPPAAGYDPEADTWRVIEDEFFGEAGAAVLWTGTELLSPAAGLAHDPATGTTRQVPSVRDSSMFTGSREFSPPRSHWTGDEVLTLGSAGVIRLDPSTGSLADGPAPPIPSRARSSAWAGGALLAVNYDLEAATFDPSTGAWSEAPPIPLRFYECTPELTSGAGVVFVGWCSGIAAWDGSGDWTLLSLPPPSLARDLVVGGDHLYSIGARVVRTSITRSGGALVQPRWLPIGVQFLDTPRDWEVTGTIVSHDSTGTRDTVGVELSGPSGEQCRVLSTYQGVNRYVAAPTVPAEITRTRDGVTIPVGEAETSEDGTARVVIDDRNGSDILEAACPSLDDARLLAARLWRPGEPPQTLPPGVAGDAVCDVEILAEARTDDQRTEVVVQLRLLEVSPCTPAGPLAVHVRAAGRLADVAGNSDPTADLPELTPDRPYLVARYVWENWCAGTLQSIGITVGDGQAFPGEASAPCLDPAAPSTLSNLGIETSATAVLDS